MNKKLNCVSYAPTLSIHTLFQKILYGYLPSPSVELELSVLSSDSLVGVASSFPNIQDGSFLVELFSDVLLSTLGSSSPPLLWV